MRGRWALALALVAGSAAAASAHTGGGAFIQLLPTHLYIFGGALVVAVSFVLTALLPPASLARVETLRRRLGVLGRTRRSRRLLATIPSLLSLAVVLGLIAAGHVGSRDPLSNPLPLVVWSVWWIGFTYVHALLGNLWVHLNPWSGLARLAGSLGPLQLRRRRPPLRYPRRAGYAPALVLFAGFAWFELIHPAPADPGRLADAVTAYLLVGFLGIALFGERAWLQYGDAFSVYFRMISWIAPLGLGSADPACGRCPECRAVPDCSNCARCLAGDRPRAVDARVPPLNLLRVQALRPSAVAFVLLALSSVSFDGLSRTFVWLGLLGVNPLEYPGRTVLMSANTAGLLAVWVLLSAAYVAAVGLGRALARLAADPREALGLFVLSIVPIALGYHLAHYLPVFLVDVQYAARAVSDPLGRGWDLLGTRGWPVIASVISDPVKVYAIWYTQVGLIVAAHVAAVWIAHALALRLAGSPGRALASQVPMVVLMIGYTLFGLWLLSTPSAG